MDSSVLFAALKDRNSLEGLLFEWCKTGDISLAVAEQTLDEIESMLHLNADQMPFFLKTFGVELVSNREIKADPEYNNWVAEVNKVPEISEKPIIITAKFYLKKYPKAVFVTDKESLKLNDQLISKARTPEGFVDWLIQF